MSSLSINGTVVQGHEVRTQNVMAVLAIARIIKSSLGPVGLDKMLVDEVGDVTITNDGATILKQLEVEHPAAKVLVGLSTLQDKEVGDGTTSVVILASEILRQANELVQNGVHPTSVIAGLMQAKKEACKFIKDNMVVPVAEISDEIILNCAKTSMSSKIIGASPVFFANMAVQAVTNVKTINNKGKVRYPVGAITVLKAHGRSMLESRLVDGFALNCTRASQQMPAVVRGAKIAMLDIDLRRAKMMFGVSVQVTDPEKLAAIRDKESDITKQRIMLLINAGVNVILTTQGMDDQAMKWLVENGVMGVRRCKKQDLKHIAKVCGGEVLLSFADMEGGESIPPEALGTAEEVSEEKVGDGELIFIKGCASTRAQTILLRGANDFMLDEVERSLHDAFCVVKRTLESKTVVPGGGAVEAALSVYLETLADTVASREQLAIACFAQSMLIIPKTLAVNGAFDATDLVAQLRAHHAAAQKKGLDSSKFMGLNLEDGVVQDNVLAGVLEPAMSKIKMIQFATEAAVHILRIDVSIKMNPKEDPKNPMRDEY